jgi:DNA-binding NarL/FixJ family response regulator
MIIDSMGRVQLNVLVVYEVGEERIFPNYFRRQFQDEVVLLDFVDNIRFTTSLLINCDILFLANLHMPSPDGYEILRQTYEKDPDLPVIVSTFGLVYKELLPPNVVGIVNKVGALDKCSSAISSLALNILVSSGTSNKSNKLQEIIHFEYPDINLIKYLAEHDKELYKIPSRFFEELLAELLYHRGWEIQLSPMGADGGIDIVAIRKTQDNSEMMLVQAKRYAEHRKVGVSVVRELLQVVNDKRATKGMIVTTSSFTKGAVNERIAYQWVLSLKDHDQIVKWLKEYKSNQQCRA